jgi:hypothetical protein
MNTQGTDGGSVTVALPEDAPSTAGLQELEMLAKDCEELAVDAQTDGDKGMFRALLSVTYRIRHAAKKIKEETP